MVPSTSRRLPLVVGWQEWVALPDLGLPAVKAKIDTGARTSALHAETIEIIARADLQLVRFTFRPAPRKPDLILTCEAPLVELRGVTSSNGTRENRPVIRTHITAGGERRAIELTLTDRGGMTYRMLLGRQALTALGLAVDPSLTFQMPKLSFKLYPGWPRRKTPARA